MERFEIKNKVAQRNRNDSLLHLLNKFGLDKKLSSEIQDKFKKVALNSRLHKLLEANSNNKIMQEYDSL